MGISSFLSSFRPNSRPTHDPSSPPRRKRVPIVVSPPPHEPYTPQAATQPTNQAKAAPFPYKPQSSPQRRHLKFRSNNTSSKPPKHVPPPIHPARRAHSAAHYTAGYDPSRPAHYPNSRVADYSAQDTSIPTRRFFNSHANRLSSAPGHKLPTSTSGQRSRRPASRIVSNLDIFTRRDPSSDRRMPAPRRKRVTSLLQSTQPEKVSDNPTSKTEPHSFDCLPKVSNTYLQHVKLERTSNHPRSRDGLNRHIAQPDDLVVHSLVRYSADYPSPHRSNDMLPLAAGVEMPSPRRSADIMAHAHPADHPQSRPSETRPITPTNRPKTPTNRPITPIMPITRPITPTTPSESNGPSTRVSVDNPTVSGDVTPLPVRMSADAAVPARMPPRTTSPLFRTNSNPTAGASRYGRKDHPINRNRPPPLNVIPETPSAAGLSEITRFPLQGGALPTVAKRESKPAMPALSSFVTDDSDPNDAIGDPVGENGRTRSRDKVRRENDGEETISEPKAYTKDNNVWSKGKKHGRKSHDGRKRHTRRAKPGESDDAKSKDALDELYNLPIASDSSSEGVLETPSCAAARNGIVAMGSRGAYAEGHIPIDPESTSASFWIKGRIEMQCEVRRKSEGFPVDGAPSANTPMICVQSLDDLQRMHTFRTKGNNQFGGESSLLGQGAGGRVYLAMHIPSGKKVAVKEIDIYDKKRREAFRNDFRTLTSYRSRFLVRSYGAFLDGERRAHVTLEFMDRGSLGDVIRKQGPVPESVICRIAEHCLRGLKFLHTHKILHRDVKTDNILLSRKQCVAKLSDFGLARDLKEAKATAGDCEANSVTKSYCGTIAYMSPERIMGTEYTYASDIWALGISLVECLLGDGPFAHVKSVFEIAEGNPLSDQIEGKASPELVDLLKLMTYREALRRPRAEELLEHECLQASENDPNALRDWLDEIPKLHGEELDSTEVKILSSKKKKINRKSSIRRQSIDVAHKHKKL